MYYNRQLRFHSWLSTLAKRSGQVLLSGLFYLLSVLPGAGQCLPAPTCRPGSAPASAAVYQMGILRVQLADLDTATADGSEGYQDYSCRRAIRLDRGTTYTLRVTTGRVTDERLRAWLDFNQDGTFDPTTEQVLASTGKQHAGVFTVPATLPVGANLRLRLAADYVEAPFPGPCTTPQYSQTEDYHVVITTASPPRPQAAFSAVDSVTCGRAVQLRDQSRNAPTAWRWDLGDGTTSTAQHPQHTYAAAGTYAVRLRVCNASGCDSLRKPAYLTVRGDGPKPAPCQPATQAYCCDFGLARVRLAELDHQPGGGAAGYQDASCAYRATLRADWPDTLHITTGGRAAHDVRVYLDLNNDGQFNSVTELLYQGLGVSNPSVGLRLSSLTLGLVYNRALRLRICADYAGSPAVGPCAAPKWGQVADYAVQVLPNTLTPHAAFTLTYAQVCGPVQVAVSNASIGSATYRWNFGDGTSSTAAAPAMHTYATPGVYAIRLVAYGPAHADSTQREVAVAANCPSYCITGGWGGNEDSPLYFTRVKAGEVDNKEYRAPRVGYRDFTSYVATVRQGQAVTILTESLPFTSGGSGPWVVTTGWADFNQNGQLEASEQLDQGTGFNPQLLTLRVPHAARLGAVRLRLLISTAVPYGLVYTNGCQPASTISTTEDYTLMVLPEATPPHSGFTADLVTSCSGQVQFRDTTWATPTSWRWSFGDGTSSTQANPQHTYSSPGRYSISLQTQNAYGTSTVTRAGYVTVTDIGQGPRPAAVALSTKPLYETYGIAAVQLSSLTYQGGEYQLGYRDETCAQPALHLAAGGSYPWSVLRTERFAYHHVYLWLDANDDGVFDPQERIETSSTSTVDAPQLGTFTIPLTAVRNRPLRLRLYWHGMRANDYPAGSPPPDPQTRDEEYDQVRDFTVWVSNATLAATPPVANSTWGIYPNPTTGLVNLTGVNAHHSVQLVNSLGQLVGHFATVPAPGSTYQVDLRTLSKGLYLLQVTGLPGAKRIVLE